MQLTGTSWSVDCAIFPVESHSRLRHPPVVVRASPVLAMMCPRHPIPGRSGSAGSQALAPLRLRVACSLGHGCPSNTGAGSRLTRAGPVGDSMHRSAALDWPGSVSASRGAARRKLCCVLHSRGAQRPGRSFPFSRRSSMQTASHALLAWSLAPFPTPSRHCGPIPRLFLGPHGRAPCITFGAVLPLQRPRMPKRRGPVHSPPCAFDVRRHRLARTAHLARARLPGAGQPRHLQNALAPVGWCAPNASNSTGLHRCPEPRIACLDELPPAAFDGTSRAFSALCMPSSTARPNRHDRLAFECAWAGARSARWTARARRVQKREVSSMPRPMRRRPEGSSHAAPGGTSCAFSGLRVPTSMARPGRRGRPALPYLARRVVPPACHGHSWARLVDPATLRAPRSIGRRVPRRHSSPVAWRVPCGPAPAAAFSPSTRRIVLPACVVSSIVSLAAPPPCGTASLLVWSGTMVDRSPRVFLALASRDVLAPRRSAGVFLLPPSLAERELLVDRWRELIGRRGVGVHLHLLPRVHAQAPRLLLTLTSARLHSPCLSPMWSRSHRARCSRSCPQIRSSSETSCNGGSSIRRLHADGGAIRTLPPLDDTLRVSHVHTGTGAHGRFRRSSMCWGGSGHGVSVTLAAQSQPDRTSARTGASGAVARRIPDDVRSARRGTLRPSHAGAEATGRVALTRNQNEE